MQSLKRQTQNGKYASALRLFGGIVISRVPQEVILASDKDAPFYIS